MAKCAFLGLGVMGFPMAGHLRSNCHEVTVWNRSEATSERWEAEYGPGAKALPSEAVQDCSYVMICVGADNDVFDVVDQIKASLKPGAVVIDHTTASPNCAETVAATLAQHDVEFLDAPISGGQSGAENGRLSVMCGGKIDVFEAAKPVMESYGKTITLLGPVGSGQTAKCVNQICIAGTLLGLSEGIRFAKGAGLDPEALLSAIGGGAAQSWQMDNRLKTMFADEFDFGFAIDWMRKDLGIALKAADRMGLDMPITEIADQRYKIVQLLGGNRQDTSALIRSYED